MLCAQQLRRRRHSEERRSGAAAAVVFTPPKRATQSERRAAARKPVRRLLRGRDRRRSGADSRRDRGSAAGGRGCRAGRASSTAHCATATRRRWRGSGCRLSILPRLALSPSLHVACAPSLRVRSPRILAGLCLDSVAWQAVLGALARTATTPAAMKDDGTLLWTAAIFHPSCSRPFRRDCRPLPPVATRSARDFAELILALEPCNPRKGRRPWQRRPRRERADAPAAQGSRGPLRGGARGARHAQDDRAAAGQLAAVPTRRRHLSDGRQDQVRRRDHARSTSATVA